MFGTTEQVDFCLDPLQCDFDGVPCNGTKIVAPGWNASLSIWRIPFSKFFNNMHRRQGTDQ